MDFLKSKTFKYICWGLFALSVLGLAYNGVQQEGIAKGTSMVFTAIVALSGFVAAVKALINDGNNKNDVKKVK